MCFAICEGLLILMQEDIAARIITGRLSVEVSIKICREDDGLGNDNLRTNWSLWKLNRIGRFHLCKNDEHEEIKN